jgi:hypothetical protein
MVPASMDSSRFVIVIGVKGVIGVIGVIGVKELRH